MWELGAEGPLRGQAGLVSNGRKMTAGQPRGHSLWVFLWCTLSVPNFQASLKSLKGLAPKTRAFLLVGLLDEMRNLQEI